MEQGKDYLSVCFVCGGSVTQVAFGRLGRSTSYRMALCQDHHTVLQGSVSPLEGTNVCSPARDMGESAESE